MIRQTPASGKPGAVADAIVVSRETSRCGAALESITNPGCTRQPVSRGTSIAAPVRLQFAAIRPAQPIVTRILCLGMSALDAIYRVPAIPTTPTKVLATAFYRMRRRHGRQRQRRRRPARRRGALLGTGRRRRARRPDPRRSSPRKASMSSDVRRLPGCTSPSAAILIADDGERLVCAYNDPALDRDPSWLPLEQVAATFAAVLADVRWPEGAAAVLDAARALPGVRGPRRRRRAARRAARPGPAGDARRLLGTRPRLARRDRGRRAACLAASRAGIRRGRRRHARAGRLPLARRQHRAPGTAATRSSRSTRSPPATSGTARSRWRSAEGMTIAPPPASPTPRPRSSARATAAGTGAPTRAEVDAFRGHAACSSRNNPYKSADLLPADRRALRRRREATG